MVWGKGTEAWVAARMETIARRRRRNPVREARRQHQITRQRVRVDSVPSYRETPRGYRYLGHVQVTLAPHSYIREILV